MSPLAVTAAQAAGRIGGKVVKTELRARFADLFKSP
jgi:hypothetical protein